MPPLPPRIEPLDLGGTPDAVRARLQALRAALDAATPLPADYPPEARAFHDLLNAERAEQRALVDDALRLLEPASARLDDEPLRGTLARLAQLMSPDADDAR